MIRFACPSCGKIYKTEDDRAGQKSLCKKCGAVVLVPESPPREVLYGVPLPPTVDEEPLELHDQCPTPQTLPPTKRLHKTADKSPHSDMETEAEDDYDFRATRLRRRRRQRAKFMVLVKLGLFVLCLVGIVAGASFVRDRLLLVEQGKAKFR